MDAAQLTQHIIGMLDGVDVVEANGDTFLMYDPGRDLPPDRRMPFATIVTSDFNDRASDLDRLGVFRVNIGVTPETYESLLGPPPPGPITADPIDTGHDYTQLDTLMPHPIYAPLHWVCILNPGDASLDRLDALIAEAHALAAGRRTRHDARE
jgi:hypothetical protein